MRLASLILILLLLGAGPAMASPYLSCDQTEVDSFQYLVDEGPDWVSCPAVAGRMHCDLALLPAGGHLLRGRTIKDGQSSAGNSWIFIYKMPWQSWLLYYVLKIEQGGIKWELQAVK